MNFVCNLRNFEKDKNEKIKRMKSEIKLKSQASKTKSPPKNILKLFLAYY